MDRNDLEALKSLCVQWEVDLSASIAEQNARIDRRNFSRSQRQKEMGQLRDRIKRKMVAAALIAWYASSWVTAALLWRCSAASISATWMMPDGLMDA